MIIRNFLKEIGYLKDEGPDFKIETHNVDNEITENCRTTISGTRNECKILHLMRLMHVG